MLSLEHSAKLSTFEEGTIVIDERYNSVECANCGFTCGKFYTSHGTPMVTLFLFRFTVDYPRESIRLCQHVRRPSTPHRHNYSLCMSTLTIANNESIADVERSFNLKVHSQLWNSPFHNTPCRAPTPCVPTSSELITENEPQFVAPNATAINKFASISDLRSLVPLNKPVQSKKPEPMPSTSKALDSALITSEFELLSSATTQDDSIPPFKYLTRSRFSPNFQRVSYAETDGRLSNKNVVPRKPKNQASKKNQVSKKTDVRTQNKTDNNKRTVDRDYVKRRSIKRNSKTGQFIADVNSAVASLSGTVYQQQSETCGAFNTARGLLSAANVEQHNYASTAQHETTHSLPAFNAFSMPHNVAYVREPIIPSASHIPVLSANDLGDLNSLIGDVNDPDDLRNFDDSVSEFDLEMLYQSYVSK